MADHNQTQTDGPTPVKTQQYAQADSLAFQMYLKQKKRKKRNEEV